MSIFDEIDRDKDGTLTGDEIVQFCAKNVAKVMEKICPKELVEFTDKLEEDIQISKITEMFEKASSGGENVDYLALASALSTGLAKTDEKTNTLVTIIKFPYHGLLKRKFNKKEFLGRLGNRVSMASFLTTFLTECLGYLAVSLVADILNFSTLLLDPQEGSRTLLAWVEKQLDLEQPEMHEDTENKSDIESESDEGTENESDIESDSDD